MSKRSRVEWRGKVEPHGQVECLGGNCKVRSKFVHHGTTSRHALDTLSSYREGRISGQICSLINQCQKLLLENTKVQLCLQFFSYGDNFSKSVTCTGNMKGTVNSLISGRIGILYPAGCPVGTGYPALRLAGYPAGRISGIISIRCTHLHLGGPFQYRLCSSLVT